MLTNTDFHGKIIGNEGIAAVAQIVVVEPQKVNEIWPQVKEHLDPAIAKDLVHDEISLKTAVAEDRALLWLAVVDGKIMGAVITVIEKFKITLVNILSLGGKEFKRWKDEMNQALTLYASAMGCKYIVANGSEGWRKLWPDFTPGNTCYLKEIF